MSDVLWPFCSLLLDPFIIECFFSTGSIRRIVREHFLNEFHGLTGYISPLWLLESELAGANLVKYLLMSLPLEWWLAAQQDIHDHSTAPHIALLIIQSVEYFRSDVVGCSEFVLHFRVRIENDGSAEINNFNVIYLVSG